MTEQYRDGQIDQVTNASQVWIGDGTDWKNEISLSAPCTIKIDKDGESVYTIATIISATRLLTSANYGGTTGSGLDYMIMRSYTSRGYWRVLQGDNDFAEILSQETIDKIDDDIDYLYDYLKVGSPTSAHGTTASTFAIHIGATLGRFWIDNLTASRDYRLPDQNATLAGLGVEQSFSADQTFNASVHIKGNASIDGTLDADIVNVPDLNASDINATMGDINTLHSATFTANNLNATIGDIATLHVETLTASNLTASQLILIGEVQSELLQTEDILTDFVVSGLLPSTSASLTSNISTGQAYVTGKRIAKANTTIHTYTGNRDTYVDISKTALFTFSGVLNASSAPSIAASSLRLAKTVTNATAILSVTDLRELDFTIGTSSRDININIFHSATLTTNDLNATAGNIHILHANTLTASTYAAMTRANASIDTLQADVVHANASIVRANASIDALQSNIANVNATVDDIIAGNATIDGTISTSFGIDTDGNCLRIKSTNLTASRYYHFPDYNASIPSLNASQDWAETQRFNILTASILKTNDPIDEHGVGDRGFCDIRYRKATIGVNLIGTAGAAGFAVGICPPQLLPDGMISLPGYDDPTHDNYGNYLFKDGSIMCWVPKFYYLIATNDVTIKGIDTYANENDANADNYAMSRAFIDGGVEQQGFFFDKYQCSKNAWGTGQIASSIKNGLPLSTAAAHNQIVDLTACAGNLYYEVIKAAHARDGVDGAENASSIFHCASKFQYAALSLLSLAHGQASSAITFCDWYDATYNYPKGCNNNALKDYDEVSNGAGSGDDLLYVTDGYSQCGKTGSGVPFAKSTHNGQNCGIADLNGLMHEISIGLTCIAPAAHGIEAITNVAAPVFTWTGHGLNVNDYIIILSITQADWTNFKNKMWKVATVPNADTFTLTSAPDASGYAAYDAGVDGGTFTKGTFYLAKEATAMKDFDSSNVGASDHWGATGVAAMMDSFTPAFESAYAVNDFSQRFGSGANQVLSEAMSGNAWLLTGLGFPKDVDGIDATGTNQFGKDYFYQYIKNELCARSCRHWGSTSNAGVWSGHLDDARGHTDDDVGFRAACYSE